MSAILDADVIRACRLLVNDAPPRGAPSVDELIETVEPTQVAGRLRALVGNVDQGNATLIARRLGVDETVLLANLDATCPRLNADILTAAIREFGVDPSWLLTGKYNSTTHYAALDEKATEVKADVERRIAPRLSPPPSQAVRAADIPPA